MSFRLNQEQHQYLERIAGMMYDFKPSLASALNERAIEIMR
jgi:hypothetical protein